MDRKIKLLFLVCIVSLYGYSADLNLSADSIHAPFYYGVASGDPLHDKVIIWSHITSSQASETVTYELALQDNFVNIVASGNFTTNANLDYTIKIDVGGLSPNTTYYYRFKDSNNKFSSIGRTRTAPISSLNEIKFAVVSCSAIFSGYFNAYRKIAERNDLSAIIHLGDYIYEDRVPAEEYRVPTTALPVYPRPINKEQWRSIHKFWLTDPDLRYARQQHPFIQLWDNHDTDGSSESIEAFMNWEPVRENQANLKIIYRQLKYGNLVDVFITDIDQWRGRDFISGSTTEKSCLGNDQYNWFKNAITSSTAKWKLVGTQKMFSHWSVPSLATIIGNGGIVNVNSWDGCLLEREMLLRVIDSNKINNVVMISGDSHVSIASDVPYIPFDSTTYNDSTGFGSICIEFAPPSVSRGNFNEKGVSAGFINTVLRVSKEENPNQQYLELTKHGYGIMHFNNDSLRTEIRYCDILEKNNLDTLGKEMIAYNLENHWKRKEFDPTTSIKEASLENGNVLLSKLYPNPADKEVSFDIELKKPADVKVSIYQLLTYKEINSKYVKDFKNLKKDHIKISVDDLPKGTYILLVETDDFYEGQVFFKL